jgi:hypothetical protein
LGWVVHAKTTSQKVNDLDPDAALPSRVQRALADDATLVRALKIYPHHTQANALDFINDVSALGYFASITADARAIDRGSRPTGPLPAELPEEMVPEGSGEVA